MAFSLKKIKPIHILLIGIVIVFVYMTFFNHSSSKFGASSLVIPSGVTSITITFNVTGISTPVKATLSLLGQSPATELQIISYYAPSSGTSPMISWSVNGVSNASATPPVADAPVTGVNIPNYAPAPGSALTQCIGTDDHLSYGYASQDALANAACAAGGLPGTATKDEACTGGNKYLCSEATGNVSIDVPAFSTSGSNAVTLVYTEYGPNGTVESTENIPTSAYGSKYSGIKADTLPFAGGTIAIKVKTVGSSDVIYYWTVKSSSNAIPTTPTGLTGSAQGITSFSKDNPPTLSIKIPSSTISLKTSGTNGTSVISNISIA